MNGQTDRPLALRLSPATLEEFVGQSHILGPGKLLRRAIEADRITSAVFFGPPGTGKSAVARLIAKRTNAPCEELNAVTAGVADLRRVIERARTRQRLDQAKTLLLLEEIHHFNRTQQDALLPDVEAGIVTLVGLTTENPYFYVNSALLSRSLVFEFFPLSQEDLAMILDHALADPERGLGRLRITLTADAREHFLRTADGDARRLLNALEIAALTTPPDKQGVLHLSLGVVEESLQKRAIRYDKHGDAHYDTISAFIKSMRGGDPDATIYWMAKMLLAGEDPRFIARRIIICASEDVGNADPQALVVAQAALSAVEFVGMPEAKIPLAQAALYVATAPKSNAAYRAITRAWEEVEQGPPRPVPPHLCDAGYRYPHDFPGHHVAQVYWPHPVTLYEPSDQGVEQVIRERLSQWRKTR
ncbi:MAG: replication-associated recombination protein A [Elusimicrobia bacterium]|nr:replication-associated recombination protein A [Elusimicrobiota bacterium]